jgi:hypothetical protein
MSFFMADLPQNLVNHIAIRVQKRVFGSIEEASLMPCNI